MQIHTHDLTNKISFSKNQQKDFDMDQHFCCCLSYAQIWRKSESFIFFIYFGFSRRRKADDLHEFWLFSAMYFLLLLRWLISFKFAVKNSLPWRRGQNEKYLRRQKANKKKYIDKNTVLKF